MPVQPRLIIHFDLDAFFVAVEVLERPDLAGKPVVVGGRPQERGVVSAASYAAREFGVRSAMPMAQALQLCPQLIVLPPRYPLYRRYSNQVMAILRQVTPVVEQVSIDEAYLDLSGRVSMWDDGIEVARALQQRVREELGLSASLGVATNKLIAKVASDLHKPGGLTVVRPGQEEEFLAPLNVQVLWGVGPKTAQKLAALGVTTVGQLAQLSEKTLWDHFGRQGLEMARHARGQDDRPVVTEHERKSVSQERTFSSDVSDPRELRRRLWRLSQRTAESLKQAGLVAGTVAIKLRYADFVTHTRQMRLTLPSDDERTIYLAALALLRKNWQRGRAVRLLGVAARDLTLPAGQLSLFDEVASPLQ